MNTSPQMNAAQTPQTPQPAPASNQFDYHSIRAKEARLGAFLNHPALKFLAIFLEAMFLIGGVALLIMKTPLAWLVLALADLLFMLILWSKLILFKVPKGKTEDLDDILSSNLLAHLPKSPKTIDLANAVIYTRSGRFLATRFGLTPEFLRKVASVEPEDPAKIFETAREIRQRTNSSEISGGAISIAILECFPGAETLLARMRLDASELEGGLTWYNYLYGLVRDAKKHRRDGGIARDFSFGYIPLLSRFGRNLSAERSATMKTQVLLEQAPETLSRMIEIFSKKGRQNVALIGPDGSGRSTIVRAFAETLLDADNKLPSNLQFRQIFALDASALISSAANRGEIEGLMHAILAEAYSAKNIILYLDNAHLFFEDGVGSVDISNLLVPVLEAGNLRMILTLDQQKFLEISAKKPALANALNKIMVAPASEAETMRIMEDRIPVYEYQEHVIYTFWAMKEAYRLSNRYIHDLEMPGRALNLLEAAAKFPEGEFVTSRSVQQAIEHTSGVKIQVAEDGEDREKLLNLEDLIHERMVDQVGAVKTVADALRRAAAGVRNENRPIGTFLFLGPTGVGKTELAKSLSEVYFGGESQIVRVDLNEYVSPDDVARLIADPTVDPSSLAAQVSKQPFSVVLLDEIEKAHPLVLTTLLQLLDEGILRDVKNREISFRDTIVIATSNAGANLIRETIEAGGELDKDALVNEFIKSGEFKAEFLNRFDEICIFKPLGKEDLKKVVDIIMQGVNLTLAPQKITVVLDDEAKELLVERGYDPALGARPMRRIVQKTVENLVAKSVLSGDTSSGETIRVTREMVEGELGEKSLDLGPSSAV